MTTATTDKKDKKAVLEYEFDLTDILDDGEIDRYELLALYDSLDRTTKQAEQEFANQFGYRPRKIEWPEIEVKQEINTRKRNLTFLAITLPSVGLSLLKLLGVFG